MVGGGGGPANAAGTPSNLRLVGQPIIRGPQWLQLPLITVSFFGFQLVWSLEMSYGIPFLLELGLSKPTMAIVFIAGPISGLVVQPIIGILADKSTHPWGRRRPYMLAGCALCSIFLFLVGYARVVPDALGVPGATTILAVLGVWGMDFAINAVMAVDRSLVFDMLPASKQAEANAWSMRMSTFGSILGFYVGDVDLPASWPFSWIPFLVKTGAKTPSEPQVRCLTLITVFCLMASHLLVAWAAVEQRMEVDVRHPQSHKSDSLSPIQTLKTSITDYISLARKLPHAIKQVLWIQIASWISWFPLMFYTTAWVSSIATQSHRDQHGPGDAGDDWNSGEAQARGTRAGAHALFLQAVVAFVCSALLPWLLPTSSNRSETQGSVEAAWLAPSWLPPPVQTALESLNRQFTAARRRAADRRPGGSVRKGVSLPTLWIGAHLLVVAVTWSTWPVHAHHSLAGATWIIAISGYAWAVCCWAPFALIGIFIQSEEPGQTLTTTAAAAMRGRRGGYEAIPDDVEEAAAVDEEVGMKGKSRSGTDVDLQHDGENGLNDDDDDDDDDSEDERVQRSSRQTVTSEVAALETTDMDSTSVRTGSVLGLHNTAIVIPQMIVSLAAALVFALFDDKEDDSGKTGASAQAGASAAKWDVVGLMIRIGGLSSIVAAWLTWRLRKRYGDLIDEADSIGVQSQQPVAGDSIVNAGRTSIGSGLRPHSSVNDLATPGRA